jgi:hypothetical protein
MAKVGVTDAERSTFAIATERSENVEKFSILNLSTAAEHRL